MDILHRISARGVSTEQAYAAVRTRAGVARWWIPTSAGDDSVGGTMTFGELIAMKVLAADPGRHVEWEVTGGPSDWIGTRVTFDIKREGGDAVILFAHRGWREASEHLHHCSTKWAAFLLSLKQYLETGVGRPGGAVIATDNW